jgi:hypothetical protein
MSNGRRLLYIATATLPLNSWWFWVAVIFGVLVAVRLSVGIVSEGTSESDAGVCDDDCDKCAPRSAVHPGLIVACKLPQG